MDTIPKQLNGDFDANIDEYKIVDQNVKISYTIVTLLLILEQVSLD